MAGTEVLTSTLNEVATSVEELTERYRQSVSRMYSVGGELDAMWEGPANRQFMYQLGSDRVRFDAMAKLLQSYYETLRNAAATYVKAENEVQTVLNTNTMRRS